MKNLRTPALIVTWLTALLLAACSKPNDAIEAEPEPFTETEPAEQRQAVVEPEVEPPEPEPIVCPDPIEYEVLPGDSLWQIAVDHDVHVADIRRATGLNSDIIFPGQTVTIPVECEEPGESETAAVSRPDVTIAGEYEVVPGDYLERIAGDHGCTVSELMVANEMNTDTIFGGQTLQIPECTGEETTVEVGENQHRVRPGDYLFLIANQYACSVGEIMSANNLTSDFITAGAILEIPTDCTGESTGPGFVSAIDTDVLHRLMQARGFDAPREFKAIVVEVTFNSERTRIIGERRFGYRSTADDTDWNPASAIKLFAAVAAIQYARDLGFTTDAQLTFRSRRDRTFSLDELVSAAIGPSDNIAYNRLVQFVGYDQLNGQFLSRANGLGHTAIRRPYYRTEWMNQGESSSLRDSPPVDLAEGGRRHTIPEREGSVATECGGAACTSVADLAELMRRLMLQEQLRPQDSFNLPRTDLVPLRVTMRTDRRRGEQVVDALANDFPAGTNFYHKAGFSEDWYSDNVYIYDTTRPYAWIVTMAGYPGRESLTEAAEIIGDIISSGELGRN
ncbi:MAG: LysM repeat protein [Bradymonadia bacterium]